VKLESLFEDEEKEEIEMIMDATPVVSPRLNKTYEVLEIKGDEELPPRIHKLLPKGPTYEFMDGAKFFPIIFNANLSINEKEKLLTVL
jgi:hypothetical protein